MKVLMYAGGEYLTGDEIAVALLEYSESLAEVGEAATVEIPIVARGKRVHATFLIGPASQIVATDLETSDEELVDPAVVDELRLLTRRLRPVGIPADESDAYVEEYD